MLDVTARLENIVTYGLHSFADLNPFKRRAPLEGGLPYCLDGGRYKNLFKANTAIEQLGRNFGKARGEFDRF
jgi:hypothetical protein